MIRAVWKLSVWELGERFGDLGAWEDMVHRDWLASESAGYKSVHVTRFCLLDFYGGDRRG